MLQPRPTAYQQALDFLYGRINYERAAAPTRELHLRRMRQLMAALGDPQLNVPIVHVAGTKGKGSVSAMLASILQAAGYRTGLYTSPHLERLEERFVIDGRPCSETELASLVDGLRGVTDQFDQRHDPPTFFELTTALAFLHFARQQAEVAVVEVGMGGRLDSTNVCQPCLTAITSISFDHTKQLGDTLEAIAGEKAGIIKPAVPVVSGVVAPGTRETIAAVARQNQSRLIQLGVDYDFEYGPTAESAADRGRTRLTYREPAGGAIGELADVELAMLGSHQAANAATAIACVSELIGQGWQIDEAAIRRGLAAARCAARIEVIGSRPTVVLDAAHNAASAKALADTIAEHFTGRPKRLLFAIAREKDIAAVLGPLAPHFEEIVLTRFRSNPRASDPEELAAIARNLPGAAWQVSVCDDPHRALDLLLDQADPQAVICIAGSFFLAAELRGRLLAAADAAGAKPAAIP